MMRAGVPVNILVTRVEHWGICTPDIVRTKIDTASTVGAGIWEHRSRMYGVRRSTTKCCAAWSQSVWCWWEEPDSPTRAAARTKGVDARCMDIACTSPVDGVLLSLSAGVLARAKGLKRPMKGPSPSHVPCSSAPGRCRINSTTLHLRFGNLCLAAGHLRGCPNAPSALTKGL